MRDTRSIIYGKAKRDWLIMSRFYHVTWRPLTQELRMLRELKQLYEGYVETIANAERHEITVRGLRRAAARARRLAQIYESFYDLAEICAAEAAQAADLRRATYWEERKQEFYDWWQRAQAAEAAYRAEYLRRYGEEMEIPPDHIAPVEGVDPSRGEPEKPPEVTIPVPKPEEVWAGISEELRQLAQELPWVAEQVEAIRTTAELLAWLRSVSDELEVLVEQRQTWLKLEMEYKAYAEVQWDLYKAAMAREDYAAAAHHLQQYELWQRKAQEAWAKGDEVARSIIELRRVLEAQGGD